VVNRRRHDPEPNRIKTELKADRNRIKSEPEVDRSRTEPGSKVEKLAQAPAIGLDETRNAPKRVNRPKPVRAAASVSLKTAPYS
jgi:hypothetical protein